jgi:hypothetical protein
VTVLAAANCSCGHFSDDRRPLAYTPGHAGLTADLPRRAVRLVKDPRTLGWLELIAAETQRARAVRETEADVAPAYYRGAELYVVVPGLDRSVRLDVDRRTGDLRGVLYAALGEERYADLWHAADDEELEELEWEREGLLDGLRLLWALA